jgi:hypothetical protein
MFFISGKFSIQKGKTGKVEFGIKGKALVDVVVVGRIIYRESRVAKAGLVLNRWTA